MNTLTELVSGFGEENEQKLLINNYLEIQDTNKIRIIMGFIYLYITWYTK